MRCEPDAATCSEPRQLTRAPAVDANPTWSNDGRWIYFSSFRTERYEVWRMPAEGGDAERITWNGGYMARESADGMWLYYSKLAYPTASFWRIALPPRGPGQQETPVKPKVPYGAAATWALGARAIAGRTVDVALAERPCSNARDDCRVREHSHNPADKLGLFVWRPRHIRNSESPAQCPMPPTGPYPDPNN